MSGPNEHHIPQFLQRSFGVRRKGKEPKEIWFYTPGKMPEQRKISRTASEHHFYGSELDGKLKVPENRLGQEFAALRKLAVGSTVDAELAAELITHLAPRSKHLRVAMLAGFHQLAMGAQWLFGSAENLGALLGLDGQAPSERFNAHFRGAIDDYPELKALGLPMPLLERVAFFVAKEQFDVNANNTVSAMQSAFGTWHKDSPAQVRDGHNNAIERMSEGKNPRRDRLAGFEWTMEAAPPEGAVLPDCVALGYPKDEAPLPMMFVDTEIALVVMPISTSTLLVGREHGAALPNLAAFNAAAAACCEEFFLGHENNPAFRALVDRIGTRTEGHFEQMVQSVVADALPAKLAELAEAPDSTAATEAARVREGSFSYNIQCLDFGDQDICQRLADAITPVVARLGKVLPMHRLDGVTIAVDYWEALRTVDRGSHDLSPILADGRGDVGIIGTAVLVVRDQEAKGRVLLSALAADYLLRKDEGALGLGLQTLVHQLVLVASMELLERAVPGSLLSLVIENPLQAWLWSEAGDALTGFIAARVAGGFGEGEQLATYYREHLCSALDYMKEVGERLRRAFFVDMDANRLGAALLPAIGGAAYWAALLIGHCEATDEAIADPAGELASALERLGLTYWLADYGRDLLSLWERLGQWRALEEILAVNRHLERLFWAVGVFPWMSPEGMRIEALRPQPEDIGREQLGERDTR